MRIPVVLAVVFAVVFAGFIGAYVFLRDSPERRETSYAAAPRLPGDEPLAERVALLEDALEEIQMQLDFLANRAQDRPAGERQSIVAVTDDSELMKRVTALERRFRAGDEKERQSRELRRLAREPDRRPIEELTQLAITAATEEEKLQALRGLRGRQDGAGQDARIAIVPEMLELARTTEDPMVRADVWRQMSGCTDPALRYPLLESAANDATSRVREEAVEALADFLPDPEVEAQLQHIMANDPDRGVRREAETLLERWRRRPR